MKILVTIALCCAALCVKADEIIVPPHPPISELSAKAKSAIVVALCHPNKDRNALEITSILKGKEIYQSKKNVIARIMPKSDAKALATDGFAEIVFFRKTKDKLGIRFSSAYALWPEKVETLGKRKFRFLAHDIKELRQLIGPSE